MVQPSFSKKICCARVQTLSNRCWSQQKKKRWKYPECLACVMKIFWNIVLNNKVRSGQHSLLHSVLANFSKATNEVWWITTNKGFLGILVGGKKSKSRSKQGSIFCPRTKQELDWGWGDATLKNVKEKEAGIRLPAGDAVPSGKEPHYPGC